MGDVSVSWNRAKDANSRTGAAAQVLPGGRLHHTVRQDE